MPYLSAKNGHWRAALLAEAADMPDEFNDRADVVSLPGSWVVGTSSRLFRVSKEGHQVEQINMPAPDARRSLLSMNVDEDPVAFILSNDGIESGWRPHPYSVMRVRLYEYDGFNNPVDRGSYAFDTASGDFAYVRGQRVKRRAGAYYLVSHAGMTPKEQPLVACADEARRENALGHNLYLQGNLEGALKLFDKAVQYDTAYRTAIFNLICTRSRLERPLGNDDLHWLDALFSDPNEAGKYKAKLIKDPDLGYWRRYPVFIDAINGWHPAKY
jgi:hypothetical protein